MKTLQMLQVEAAQRNREVFLTDSEPSQEQWGLDLKHNPEPSSFSSWKIWVLDWCIFLFTVIISHRHSSWS